MEENPTVQGLPFQVLMQQHPSYKPTYWAKLRALCRGGSLLLADDDLMRELFPKHRREDEEVYNERRQRAFYMAYAGMVVGDYVSGVLSDPVTVVLDGKSKASGKDAPLPPWYAEFVANTSKRNAAGIPKTFQRLLGECLYSALNTGAAWVRVDAPVLLDAEGERIQFNDRAAEDKAGALNVYCTRHESEQVIDWEVDDDTGTLNLCVIFSEDRTRNGIAGDRSMITKRWLVYERAGWEVYELQHKANQKIKPEDIVPLKARGVNKNKMIPVLRLELPNDLWVMDQLEGPSRELLNKWCALSWAEFQSLFSELYEFLEPPMTGAGARIGEPEERANLALQQNRGAGFVQTRGNNDKAMFVGPDTGPFSLALESIKTIRDEIFRITHQLAMAVDMGSAALGRSAESKQSDKGAREVVLGALAMPLRNIGVALLNTVASMRGDDDLVGRFEVGGMSDFVESNAEASITSAAEMDMVKMPSQTFQRIYKARLARTILKHDADEEDMKLIEKELEENITAESLDESVTGPKVDIKPGDEAE